MAGEELIINFQRERVEMKRMTSSRVLLQILLKLNHINAERQVVGAESETSRVVQQLSDD